MRSLFTIFLLSSAILYSEEISTESLLGIPIEELLQFHITPGTSLTDIPVRHTPGTVTVLTKEDMELSGARSLNELFEIYIPGLQIVEHHYGPRHMGMRGMVSDRDRKFLFIVNGIPMNNLGHAGFISERDLPFFSEIESIVFVRGAGSAVHGPGAVAGVVQIFTKKAESNNSKLRIERGFRENFSNIEYSTQNVRKDKSGISFQLGISDYQGSPIEYSPISLGIDSPMNHVVSGGSVTLPSNSDFTPFSAGELITPDNVPNFHSAYNGKPRLKIHSQYDKEHFSAWLRYTSGGERHSTAQGSPWGGLLTLTRPASYGPFPPVFDYIETGYAQITSALQWKDIETPNHWKMDYDFSFSSMDWKRYFSGRTQISNGTSFPDTLQGYREEQTRFKAVGKKHSGNNHYALGAELSHIVMGQDIHGSDDRAPVTPSGLNSQWSVNTIGVFGELQWVHNQNWTTFLGTRMDNHSDTDWLICPRISVIRTISPEESLKFIWGKSHRRNDEETLRNAALVHTTTNNETIFNAEIRYEKARNSHTFAIGSYHEDVDYISWTTANQTERVANLRVLGIEAEWSNKLKNGLLLVSHTVTKLMDLTDLAPGQLVSAMPYEFGNSISNLADNITKIHYRVNLKHSWRASASLIYYWQFQGSQDWAEYNRSIFNGVTSSAGYSFMVSPGYDAAFDARAFLHLDFIKELGNDSQLELRFHNALGWLDKDLNQRSFLYNVGTTRVEAPAVTVAFQKKF